MRKDSAGQKRGPGTLEGRSGPKGLGGVRPHSDYARPTAPIKRGEHSAGPALTPRSTRVAGCNSRHRRLAASFCQREDCVGRVSK